MIKTRRLLALAATLVLLLSACGTEDAGDAIEVVAMDFSFDPTTVSVEPGEEVTIRLDNQGSAQHSFTAEEIGIDVEADGGDTAEGSLTAPDAEGTFEFICTFHPTQMRGEIIVGAGGAGTDDDEPNEFDNVTPGESPPEGTTEGENEYDDGS